MEFHQKVRVGGTIFAVGEAAEFINLGMGGMYGIITFISVVGGALYIYADGNRGIRLRLESREEGSDIREGESPEPFDTRRR